MVDFTDDGSGGIDEAPNDGSSYDRNSEAWSITLDGVLLTENITLDGTEPTSTATFIGSNTKTITLPVASAVTTAYELTLQNRSDSKNAKWTIAVQGSDTINTVRTTFDIVKGETFIITTDGVSDYTVTNASFDVRNNVVATGLVDDDVFVVQDDNFNNANITALAISTSLGGKIAVATDATITGDGTSGDPLSAVATAAPVDSVNSKTGVVVINQTDVGLSNVDNTSDASKPISTATQTALDDKVESVVAGTNITVDNTDPLNPIVSASSPTKLYAYDEDNGVVTSLSQNDWIQVVVSPTVSLLSTMPDMLHDGSGVFTWDGVDPITLEFEAALSQMGVGNDKTCEFAWFKDDITQMMGKQDTDMSSSKFYGPATPAAVVTLANGENMRVCMKNTEDSSNTTIVNSWFKIKEW